jgi:DNA-directed RNA polymerase specialized sigma24 family protein
LTGHGIEDIMNKKNKRSIYSRRKAEMNMTENHVSVISLKEELRIENEEKKRLEFRRERLNKKLKMTNLDIMNNTAIIYEMHEIQKLIEEQIAVVALLEKSMNIITESIGKLQGIERRVFHMHRFYGKTLLEISEELGYDYGYIRKVSSQANKHIH